ncbi:MAG: MFS transporter [Bacteroidetes bacterium]|nr:MFS transporter [Bacteroidota bacterium]
MTKKINYNYLFPVLMSFFAMSFCDLVGVGVDRLKDDPSISESMKGLIPLIPSAVFIWFLILSIPIGIIQDRIGKRKMLNTGILITALGLLIPYFFTPFAAILAGFALLGIGNTIVQVSANPLLIDVVPSNRASSFLSFSQFVKAVGSMVAAPFAGWLALQYGDWKLMFLVFGLVSVVTALWLGLIKIEETRNLESRASFSSSFKLLGIGFIALMVLGIFLVVGIDVGINAASGQFFMNKYELAKDSTFAQSARSFYFFGKMIGTFFGAILLVKFASRKFLLWTSLASLLTIILLLFAPGQNVGIAVMLLIGLTVANIFPLIFSITVEKYPTRANEISGLMISAVFGGAVIPSLILWFFDKVSFTSGMLILVFSAVYLVGLAFANLKKTE